MLNFLCATAEEDLEAILSLIFTLIVIVVVIALVVEKIKRKGVKTPQQYRDDEFLHPNARGQLTPEQQRYILNTKAKSVNTKPATTSVSGMPTQHGHLGTAETYDPIVGSLGAVSDEGCDELNGVRLIATDLMYQTDDDQVAYDMDAIRKSLILGDILNNPRFKKPYGKK